MYPTSGEIASLFVQRHVFFVPRHVFIIRGHVLFVLVLSMLVLFVHVHLVLCAFCSI